MDLLSTESEDVREPTETSDPHESLPDEPEGPDEPDEPDEPELGAGAAAQSEPEPDAENEAESVSAAGSAGPGDELPDEELVRRAAALLFASPEPLGLRRLIDLLERPRPARVREALAALQRSLEEAGLPFFVSGAGGRYRIVTEPSMGDVVMRLQKEPRTERITSASLETLSIVAYRQPVTKAEVDAIRGVQSGAMLRTLVDRRLIRVVGRADQPGSPLQYGTARDFLERFGLGTIGDLPRDAELAGD